MIRTIADLLDALREKEKAALDKWNLKHGPMIGAMYEGLTRELLARAVFKDLALKVVDGKITNSSGELSRQIDCMLVEGNGQQIWDQNKRAPVSSYLKTGQIQFFTLRIAFPHNR